jgi:hypothetical protein
MHAHHGRLTGIALVAVAVVAALLVLAADAQQAAAFTTYQHGGTACSSCHNGSVTNAQCITCHTGYAAPSAAQECWSCHTPGQDVQVVKTGAPTSCTDTCHLADGATHTHNPHPDRGGCTTAGCHNVTTDETTANGSPHHVVKAPATTILSAKVAPAAVAVGKKVKVTGTAKPATALAGAKIGFKVERKVGTKWVKMKATATATVTAGGSYAWTYKAVKKGAHRVTLTIKATAAFTKKTLSRTFKVK